MPAVAHVYYCNNGRRPDFALIIRDTGTITEQIGDVKIVERGDDHLGIVTRALHDIGWKPNPGAVGIVRQGNGIGYLPIVPADWRATPTLVRITNDAARALTDLSAKLGIPGDVLASDWILRSATDARHHYRQFTDPGGYIEDQSRITGWMPSGQPHLKD